MYYVYMILCRGGGYYTGLTNDLCHRMRAHAAGKGGRYTHAHPPLALAALWRCAHETAARRLEYAIKKRLRRREKESLLAHPDALPFANLPQEDYQHVPGVTLADCLEGRFHD